MHEVVTAFLNTLNHPFRSEIYFLRTYILNSNIHLRESIKWNSPNYCFESDDRITMRIHPTLNQVQLIFHRGAKVKEQPNEKLISEDFGLLVWKGNDRAIATFKSMRDIEKSEMNLSIIINGWITVNQ